MNSKGLLSSLIYVVVVVFFSAIYILPIMKINFDYLSISGLSIIFYIIFIVREEGLRPIIEMFMKLLPYSIVMFLVARPFDFKMGFLHPLLTAWVMLFPAFLCHNIIQRNNRIEQILIISISFLMLCVIAHNTIQAFNDNPDIMRDLTASVIDQSVRLQYMMSNIGGYGIAYGSGAIVVLLVILLKCKNINLAIKILLFVLLIYMSYLVLNAQFATLLLITLFCVLLSVYYTVGNQQRPIFFLISLSVILMLPLIFEFLADVYNGTTIGHKIAAFNQSVFENGNLEEASGSRSELQLNALKLFLNSPLWGNDIQNDGHNSYIYYASHSTFLGVLAASGLIGFISYCSTYWHVVGNLFRRYLGTSTLYIPIIAYFILFSTFNPSESTDACWIIFMIVPLTYHYFNYSPESTKPTL